MLSASEASAVNKQRAWQEQMLPLRCTQGERLIAAPHNRGRGFFYDMLGGMVFEHIFQKISKNGTKRLPGRDGNGTICTRLMRFAVILL
jgi:hypothetical protein